MRILYHHRIRSKDGQFVHMEEMIRALERRGHEIDMVGPAAVAVDGLGGESGRLDLLRKVLPRAAYELLELGYGLLTFLRLWRAARRCRPDLLYERYNLHAPAGALLRRLTGIPLLLEVNAPLAEERMAHGGLGLPSLAAWIERWIWRSADHVITVSHVLARRIEDAGVPAERIAVMPNGIDLQRFDPNLDPAAAKQRYGLEGKTVLGFVGFARSWHGLDRIVDWLATTGDDELVLAITGNGQANVELEAQAGALGIADRVRFIGVVQRGDIAQCLASFDVALQPAVVDYASPLKLFEYMAMGKAIVAPATANIEEILSDGVDALLGDACDLTQRLERLLGDADLRARLGRAARAAVKTRRLTWESNAAEVERLAALYGAGRADPSASSISRSSGASRASQT